ncbi:Patatin [Candidatus Sulfobium mesophilum]|uniref:Patatin n=1 Tax=Candidatus Sulfobium mesophilum TaxID=2016548 RepID=A0A2U3QIR2_9BACT|nr:Patatin [Candidatus Sulfobium mesophilum]
MKTQKRHWQLFTGSVQHRLYIGAVMLIIALSSCAQKEIQPPPRAARIAVVLGAGASRGFAHIGVLKVLEANKVPIHMIVGTSAGSFVGSLYAYGYNAFQLQKISFSIEKGDIADITIPDNGFLKGEKLEEYVNSMVKNTPIEKLRMPFYAVSTNIPGGQEVVFGKGNTGTAVRASCSIPGVFRPARIGDKMYVDGGVVSPVAVDAAKRYGADIVIAVDISADMDTKQPEGTIDTILQTINIMYSKLAGLQISRADIIIRPKVGYIGSADFDKRHEAILEGEKAAYEAMGSIKALLDKLRREGRLD